MSDQIKIKPGAGLSDVERLLETHQFFDEVVIAERLVVVTHNENAVQI